MDSPQTLLIEGWRFIPHSYAVVNQFQCLQFLREPNLSLAHRDVPYFNAHWRPVGGIFNPDAERALREMPAPQEGDRPDAVFRISFPYNISPSIGRRTVVFGTAECQCVPAEFIAGNRSLIAACADCDAVIVTPSNWSRQGFIQSGADPQRVFVVPHGVDPSVFHPLEIAERAALRTQNQWNGFMFLTLGAMTLNKGIEPLLKAFAVVVENHPQARLVMKGLGALYSSAEYFKSQTKNLTAAEVSRIQPRLTYIDRTLSFADIARLYQMADAYVSPYAAEGFNMPVLEAVASGLPVICTAGGPTDEFTTDDFALRINSTVVPVRQSADARGMTLKIDFDHLVYQMMMAIESPELAGKARIAGPAWVAGAFTWGHITQRLLRILFAG